MIFLHISPPLNRWNNLIWVLVLGGGVIGSDGTQIFHHIFMHLVACGKLTMALPNGLVFLCLGACWVHRTRPHYANPIRWLIKHKWKFFANKNTQKVPQKCLFRQKKPKKLGTSHFGDFKTLHTVKCRHFWYRRSSYFHTFSSRFHTPMWVLPSSAKPPVWKCDWPAQASVKLWWERVKMWRSTVAEQRGRKQNQTKGDCFPSWV